MDTQKEYATLMEAYNAVYENQEQLDGNILEGSYEDRIAANNKKYDANRKRAAQRAQARNEARARGENVGSSRPERTTYRDSAGVERHHSGARMPKNEEVETDLFDYLLEYLVAEGYADTNKAALAIMANMSEEWRQDIMEISQKTATKAYAASKTGEFEGADSARDVKRTDNLGKHIKRKFGDKAVKHAERAADAQTFGRKDASGRSKKRPEPRIQKSDYRTTQDGKMHKQDQRELKTNLRIRRDRRLRAAEDN